MYAPSFDQNEIAHDARARRMESSRQRIALFKALQVDFNTERQVSLEKIIHVAKAYIRMYQETKNPLPTLSDTPQQADNVSTSPSVTDTMNTKSIHQTYDDISFVPMTCPAYEELHYFLLTMLRLSYTCPFRDVRHAFQLFLKTTMDTGIPIPQPRHLSPSFFIPLQDIFSLESSSSANVISYPRPCNLSISPWSQDGGEESFDTNKSTPIQCHQPKHRPRLTHLSSSSSLWKSTNLIASESSSSSVCSNSEEESDSVEGDDNASRKSTGGRPSDEYVRQMLVKSYLDEGRLTNLYRVLSFFPTFFETFHVTMNTIIKSSTGPLNKTWRIYLGIMASAEQQCQYLVSTLKLDFLQNGGNQAWLKGIDHCPEKLQRMAGFLKKMARQPWRLTDDDILCLMRVTGSSLATTWSKSELVQAILVISTFLGLSNFVLSCGIAPEMDMRGGYRLGCGSGSFYGIENELNEIMDYQAVNDELAIRAASSATGWYDSQISPTSLTDDDVNQQVDRDDSEEEWVGCHNLYLDETTALISKLKSSKDTNLHQSLETLNLFSRAPEQQGNSGAHIGWKEADLLKKKVNAVYEDLSRFTTRGMDPLEYEEFEPGHCVEFMLSEYCWEDHGCDLVNQHLPGIGDKLDDEFTESLSITDWSIFHQVTDGTVDTSPLRNAIFAYVQQILGVTKEDYDYDDIEKYLGEQTQCYIQKVCRRPHLLDRLDWNSVGISLRPEEKCHMNLLIASARKQALLCYGLSLISHV